MYRAVVTQQAKESEAGGETRGDDLWTYYTTVIIIIPNQKIRHLKVNKTKYYKLRQYLTDWHFLSCSIRS